VAHARRVLVEVDDLLARADQLKDPMAGTLRIGVIPTIAPYLLAEVMPHAKRAYPRLQLLFREEKTESIVASLREGRIDAGLLALESDLVGAARAAGQWSSATIAVEVLLLDDGHCFREQALAVCARAGVEENEMRATSLATLVQMVSSGVGVTLLPELAVGIENRRGQIEVRPFAGRGPHRTIALVWRPHSPFGDALRALAGTFAQALGRRGRAARA